MKAPTQMAKMAAQKEATVAWICTRAMFPTIILSTSRVESMFPKLACVESRDAKHMSRLPFKPNRLGTRMKSSPTCTNTFQCCARGTKGMNDYSDRNSYSSHTVYTHLNSAQDDSCTDGANTGQEKGYRYLQGRLIPFLLLKGQSIFSQFFRQNLVIIITSWSAIGAIASSSASASSSSSSRISMVLVPMVLIAQRRVSWLG